MWAQWLLRAKLQNHPEEVVCVQAQSWQYCRGGGGSHYWLLGGYSAVSCRLHNEPPADGDLTNVWKRRTLLFTGVFTPKGLSTWFLALTPLAAKEKKLVKHLLRTNVFFIRGGSRGGWTVVTHFAHYSVVVCGPAFGAKLPGQLLSCNQQPGVKETGLILFQLEFGIC